MMPTKEIPQTSSSSSTSAPPRSNGSGNGVRRLSSRLQQCAPASLQISPLSNWNVAIPLLSPLATSPALTDPTVETIGSQVEKRQTQDGELEKPVFKRWLHPAAPLCYEPPPFPRPFVPV